MSLEENRRPHKKVFNRVLILRFLKVAKPPFYPFVLESSGFWPASRCSAAISSSAFFLAELTSREPSPQQQQQQKKQK